MQEFVNKEKALELSKEIETTVLETNLSINAATRLISEQYKKNRPHSDQTYEDENKNILKSILTYKVNIENGELYFEDDGQTFKEL